MNLILAGLGKLLVHLSATFVLLGTAYLLLFAPNADGPVPLPPEQIAENLAPIGRVQVAEPPASIPAAIPAPAPNPASASTPMTTPDQNLGTAMDKDAVAGSEEPVADEIGTGKTVSVVAEAPVAVVAKADIPPASPTSVPVAVPEQSPTAQVTAPTADDTTEASLQIYPDRNGMHGRFRLTPEGFILYPASMVRHNTHLFPIGPIRGSFWATPSGVAYFRLQPTPPVD